MQPDLAEANNDLGALLAQEGDLDAAISRFRAALTSIPDYPDALNNLGYALLLTGGDQEARTLYERALALQPDFPEALNNLGLLFGRAGDMNRAERYFRDALGRRPDYGEAANDLALVLAGVGIFGVTGYAVAQRTREFGIRFALGAQRMHVGALVLRRVVLLAGIGLAIGYGGRPRAGLADVGHPVRR